MHFPFLFFNHVNKWVYAFYIFLAWWRISSALIPSHWIILCCNMVFAHGQHQRHRKNCKSVTHRIKIKNYSMGGLSKGMNSYDVVVVIFFYWLLLCTLNIHLFRSTKCKCIFIGIQNEVTVYVFYFAKCIHSSAKLNGINVHRLYIHQTKTKRKMSKRNTMNGQQKKKRNTK